MEKEIGTRKVQIGEIIYINRFDFKNTSEKSKHYLTLSSSVILKQSGLEMIIVRIVKDENENLDRLDVRLEIMQKKSPKGKKVLTWLCDPIKARLNIFNNLLSHEDFNKKDDIDKQINRKSWLECEVLIEDSVNLEATIGNNFKFGQVYQAERFGYIVVDPRSEVKNLIFNMVCFLKIHEDLKKSVLSVCKERL